MKLISKIISWFKKPKKDNSQFIVKVELYASSYYCVRYKLPGTNEWDEVIEPRYLEGFLVNSWSFNQTKLMTFPEAKTFAEKATPEFLIELRDNQVKDYNRRVEIQGRELKHKKSLEFEIVK